MEKPSTWSRSTKWSSGSTWSSCSAWSSCSTWSSCCSWWSSRWWHPRWTSSWCNSSSSSSSSARCFQWRRTFPMGQNLALSFRVSLFLFYANQAIWQLFLVFCIFPTMPMSFLLVLPAQWNPRTAATTWAKVTSKATSATKAKVQGQ